jgi:dolichol kinase
MEEKYRQAVHILAGVSIITIAWLFGKSNAVLVAGFAIIFILLFIAYRKGGHKISLLEGFMSTVERPHGFAAKGALEYAIGAVIALQFIPETQLALATIAMLAIGDGASTIVGKGSKSKLQWNSDKSWTGLAAFVIFGAWAALVFISWQRALIYAVILALVESIPWRVDDNLSIPTAAVLLWALGL